MKQFYLVFLFLIASIVNAQETNTQPQITPSSIPVEAMIGNEYSSYQVVINKQIGSPYSKFSFYSMVNYDMYYDDEIPDNYFIQTIFFYGITERIGVGIGANSKPYEGTKPLISLSYSIYTETIGLYIQPSYELDKDGLFELYNLFSWTPFNEKLIQPYVKIELYTSWGSEHSYSYSNLRLGIQYKIVRIGPALNISYFGGTFDNMTNWGGFINIKI
jgi:hypothetical protein